MSNFIPGFTTYTLTHYFKILCSYAKEFQRNVVIPAIHVQSKYAPSIRSIDILNHQSIQNVW